MITLADLFTSSGQWDLPLLRRTYDSVTTKAILNMPTPSNTDLGDKWIWALTSSGTLTVKSAYLADQKDKFASNCFSCFLEMVMVKLHPSAA
ncbi:hypothetical protein TorRG33x02_349490 [Trema orientale]|uniref:Uncharacterized protein n=1 Tax=Trema orientale TaxID=63057 RepID=A0A2P5AIM2_TREOI|nr:hypothetical protein TorRG33x02_349490 [Trema orientale]